MPRDGAIIFSDLKFIWTGGLLQFQEEALRLNTASYRGHNGTRDLMLVCLVAATATEAAI